MSEINERESEDLPTHVAACGFRYGELRRDVKDVRYRLTRLEIGMVSGMVVIIGLLTKIAFRL